MSLTLPKPTPAYDFNNESRTRQALESEDRQNVKRSDVFDSFKIKDTVTGAIKTVTIASGAWIIS